MVMYIREIQIPKFYHYTYLNLLEQQKYGNFSDDGKTITVHNN